MPTHVVPSESSISIDNPISLDDEPKIGRRIAIRFITLFTLFIVIFGVIISVIYQTYTRNLENRLLAQEEAFIVSSTNLLQKEMHTQLLILNMTSKSKALSDYLESHSESDRNGLVSLFKNLILTFQFYDQVRLLDLEGNEILRVDRENEGLSAVLNNDLQSKNHRYYFQQALKLNPQEIYVSPMDLNVENGKIEKPYRPTIRFITPVVNEKDHKIGLLVFNYSATELLENFRHQITLRLNGQGMLIDPHGYWLSNHDRSNEWGLDLGKPENHFKKRYPHAWPIIKEHDNGTLKTANGLFRYQSVDPLNFNQIESPNRFTEEHLLSISNESIENTDWKMVIFLPNETIEEQSLFHKPGGIGVITVLILAFGLILLLLITLSEQRKFRRQRNRQINAELKDLYENAPCGYHSLNADGLITRINNTELNWLGYNRDEVLGHSYREFLTPKSQKTFDSFLTTLINKKSIEDTVLEIQTKSGKTFFASTSAVALLNEGNFALARASTFDISDRIKLEKRLEYLANTDVLTGLSNRRHFFEEISSTFNQPDAQAEPLSILMLDIDNFKSVNDNYGHDAGDIVLKAMTQTILSHLTSRHIFARLGGEEFVITTPTTLQEAKELAETLRVAIESQPISVTKSLNLPITLSIGVANKPPSCHDVDEVLKNADLALYQAKQKGRNRVEIID
ncbi:sensor domain-containing diguanylate cyclase [Vibrio aphrogenes]|uniref:sensor domain-containing diguanylate cyclase n=1 Tax=Vibrio aphrogenes TaxID=1891186 RepID=UPI0013DF0478|nr:diguanylate cyclase [Vibrio aphrogenes]